MSAHETRLAGAEQLLAAYALNADVGRDPVLEALEEEPILTSQAEELASALRLHEPDERVTAASLIRLGLDAKVRDWVQVFAAEAWKEPWPRAVEALRAARAYVTMGRVLEATMGDLTGAPLTDHSVSRLATDVADTLQNLGVGAADRLAGERSARDYAEEWRERFLDDVGRGSCTWGSRVLDGKAGTFSPGTVTAVAGLPGHGKSVLAMHASRASAEAGKRCLYVCLEMSESELAMRLMCNSASIYQHTLKDVVRDHDDETWANVIGCMPDVTLKVCGLRDARAMVRKAYAEKNPYDLVVFDYLQMFPFGNERESQASRLEAAVYFIKREIALRYRTAALVLCQFSKQEDGSSMPRFRNVRGASAIEDAVDVAVCIRRDAEPTGSEMFGSRSFALDFIVPKFRNGEPYEQEPYPSVRLFGGKFRIEDPIDSTSEAIDL